MESSNTSTSKLRQKTDISDNKQNPWFNIKVIQHMHIKGQQQTNIKSRRRTMVGDNQHHHDINHTNHMSDTRDIGSTSSDLTNPSGENIVFTDINMLIVSQPRLPTPTQFDGSSPPFHKWASQLRTFLGINGFQYSPQMDVAFREDAPIQLHHLCSGTEVGAVAQDALTNNKETVKTFQKELADDLYTRDDAVINKDIAVLEADNIMHQVHFKEKLGKVKRASGYLAYVLVHSTKTGSEPNHYIRRLHESENGFESWQLRLRYSGGHRLGTYSLLQNILAPRWTEQHQHHQFRTWMENIARYESESGMVIDDHLKLRQ